MGEKEEARNAISEPDLARVQDKAWDCGFPPGTTVDELWLYRRKKARELTWPQDNLRLEHGSFQDIKSEYTRRYINYYDLFGSSPDLHVEDLKPVKAWKPPDHLNLEGDHDYHPEYAESFCVLPLVDDTSIQKVSTQPLEMDPQKQPDQEMVTKKSKRDTSLKNAQSQTSSLKYSEYGRRHLCKRPTNLKIEGDQYFSTETAEKFIEYLLSQRPRLLKRSTSLKLEGEMDTKTESREKFVEYEPQTRPPLCKKFTNLHLEGDMDIKTEQKEKYVAYKVKERPPLLKKFTNLHLEGELDMMPEYRQKYVEYKDVERARLVTPVNNLLLDGFTTETDTKSFRSQIHPKIPFLRGPEHTRNLDDVMHTEEKHREEQLKELEKLASRAEPSQESQREKEIKVPKIETPKVPHNLTLEGSIDMNPEYRNAYVDYFKDGKLVLPKATSRRQVNNLKSEGRMIMSPEYSHSYRDFPRSRPSTRKPTCSLSQEGEVDLLTEKSEKYVPYGNVPRTKSLKRKPELKLEGEFECQPEYRKAYVDYLIRERIDRKPRPLDNLGRHEDPDGQKETDNNNNTPNEKQGPSEESPTNTEQKQRKRSLVRQKESLLPSPPPKPSSSSTSSIPSPRTSARIRTKTPSHHKSLSHIETCAFGPQLSLPPRHSSRHSRCFSPSYEPSTFRTKTSLSRSVSPSCHDLSGRYVRSPSPAMQDTVSSRRRRTQSVPRSPQLHTTSTTDSDAVPQRPKRFDSPVRVPNLAYVNRSTPPPPPVINTTTRRKWMKDDSVDSAGAFVVLDKENNTYCASGRKRNIGDNIIYKEYKYTPSWHENI